MGNIVFWNQVVSTVKSLNSSSRKSMPASFSTTSEYLSQMKPAEKTNERNGKATNTIMISISQPH